MSFRKPKVSVILTFHNRPVKVERALKSLASQTFRLFEIILVDDYSEKRPIVPEKALADVRVVQIRNDKNLGANGSRLAGLRLAKGDFICFHDDDDYWFSEKLQKQVGFLESHPEIDLVSCWAQGTKRVLEFPARPSLLALSIHNCVGSFSLPMIRSSRLLGASLDNDLSNAQDWHVWRSLARVGEVAVIQEPLVFFDDGDHDRISNVKNKKKYVHIVFAGCSKGSYDGIGQVFSQSGSEIPP